jgi:hypothetical protein
VDQIREAALCAKRKVENPARARVLWALLCVNPTPTLPGMTRYYVVVVVIIIFGFRT